MMRNTGMRISIWSLGYQEKPQLGLILHVLTHPERLFPMHLPSCLTRHLSFCRLSHLAVHTEVLVPSGGYPMEPLSCECGAITRGYRGYTEEDSTLCPQFTKCVPSSSPRRNWFTQGHS